MHEINIEIGSKIRSFRKASKLTISQLGELIYKSKATISKYEKGEISIDIVTLYQIADALNINIEQLVHSKIVGREPILTERKKGSFNNANRYYAYSFDGRNNKLVRTVIDIYTDPTETRHQTMLYMNVKNFEEYHNCENTYIGYTQHYDALTTMILQNKATPIENITLNILASFVESDRKWGLFSGVSFRPFMPIATKILLSKKPLDETNELIVELKISKEDIRLLKIFNMLSVT